MTSQNGMSRKTWLMLKKIENIKSGSGFADMANEGEDLKSPPFFG